ncbi:MAG: hypothetical protein WAL04_00385 [Acidimicrobiales bacterium]|jgi:hypothetical protein
MSSITKQPRGSYRARHRMPDARTRSKSFARWADVERFLTTVDHSKLVGDYTDNPGRRIEHRVSDPGPVELAES